LFQNAESFQAAGLDHKKAPQSWEELVTYSTKLTQKQGSSFSRIGFNLPYGGSTNFIHWIGLNDGKLLSDDATKVAFDTPQGLETLQWMLDSTNRVYGSRAALEAYLAEVGAGGAAGVSRAIDAAQYQGKIGMWTQSVAFFYIIQTEARNFNASFQYGAGLIPHNTKNPRAKQVVLDDTVWVYDIPQGSKKVDAAWEWTKYITAGEGNRRFNLTQFRPSPVVKYNDDPEFAKNNPHWDVVKRQLSLSQPLPQTPAWPKVNTALNAMVTRVLAGTVSPKEALSAAAQEGQLALDEARR
jgi:ABC-type glycerol-3-phosphate transport system substrate-binding protein